MGEFFKGWRRKAGCVSLVMACVFIAGWVRTFCACDFINMKWISVLSLDGSLGALCRTYPKEKEPPWQRPQWQSSERSEIDSLLASDFQWKWRVLGTGYALAPRSYYIGLFVIPYWSIAIPLTMLSAYLLFSKPRLPKSPTEST